MSEQRVAIITGASTGIGRTIALTLAAEGYRVVLAARSADKLNDLAAAISNTGGHALTVPTDVTDPNAINSLVETTLNEYGRIDVLINNAGVGCFREFETLDTDQILQTLETNLTGSILMTRAVISTMLAQRSGRIVNLASTSGKQGPAFAAVYAATKAGLVGFTQSLRGEYRKRGVLATAVCPGFTTNGGIYDKLVQRSGRKTPMTMGSTNDKTVAKAVLKAIRKAPPEIIVNWPPLRPVIVLRELLPTIVEKVIVATTRPFMKRIAEANRCPETHDRCGSPDPAETAKHRSQRAA